MTQTIKNLPAMQESHVRSLDEEDPLGGEGEMRERETVCVTGIRSVLLVRALSAPEGVVGRKHT